MDVVVRTPHGDADIDIVAAPTDTTLADLVRAVTGQAPPATATVDGRTVSTSQLMADLDLVIGSLIDTRPTAVPPVDGPGAADVVGVTQVTGRGAGVVRLLHPGRYRVGSARRLHASELESAPVETTAFELAVQSDGAVTVVPGPDVGGALGIYTPTLGNLLLDRELPWTGGRLHVGGRLFELESPPVMIDRQRRSTPARDGSVPFQRPPPPPPSQPRLVVDAIRDAASGGGRLWQRRPSDPGAFDIPFGIEADGVSIASVDLQRHRGVALVGSDRFTAGLARTLLVELCAMHGPADLDVAIASTPDRIANWNWAKWFPHIRNGVPSAQPNLFADPESLAAWATSQHDSSGAPAARRDGTAVTPDPAQWQPPTSTPSRTPVTLLLLDDISLWSQRDSPIRSLLTDPPPELRIVALCVGLHEAPGLCTTLLEEVPPADRLAHLSSITTEARVGRPALFGSLTTQHTRLADAPGLVPDIRPALVEVPEAADVARHLAPLDDLDALRRLMAPTRLAPPTLNELVEESARNDRSVDGLTVAIGVSADTDSVPAARRSTALDLTTPRSTIIAASDIEQHDQTVAALVLGAAAQRRPDELAILIVGRERPPWHAELPHIAGWAGRDEADDAPRLVHRVAHVLVERPDLHVVVIIEHAFDRNDPLRSELITGMTELALALPNVHVVLTADHPDSVPEASRAACGSFAWIAPNGDGTAWFTDRSEAFVGVGTASSAPGSPGPTELDAPHLVIRPTTHGRAMTPLERRLRRSTDDDAVTDADDLATAAVARQITSRAASNDDETPQPSLLPPPLPLEIDAATLLARHPGDGVPIGLVDRPELAGNQAYWWQPGSDGSILAAGSPRSGMTSLIDLITTGVAARIAADDLHLYAIEALPQRRRAFEALPHTGAVVTPDDPTKVARLITGLHTMMTERLEAQRHDDRPDIVLLIGDAGRMRRALTATTPGDTFEQLGELASAGASVGMNVVVVATRVDDLGALTRLTGDRLVGPLTDPDDRARLDAPPIGPADRHPRRCWSTTADRRVQLATPPANVEAAIERLAPEPARHQRPVMIIPASTS
jgi:S-DNA-T family DNA segregation ATPase FtsK/SpoIIIE